MRAVQLVASVGLTGIRISDIPEPEHVDDLVVVDLYAAGVSYPDLLQCTGSYQVVKPLPSILGVEGAGTVRSAPERTGLSVGQRVAVLCFDGSWQQTVAVHPSMVFPLPDSVSIAAGAGFLMNYLTVHFALDERAHSHEGESILVHGAAGGVGTAALQVASALGLETCAVVSSEDKALVAKANGARHIVLADGFKDEVRKLTGDRGVDIVLDPVGGDRFTDSSRSLATNGRAVVLGFAAGDIPTVKVNRLLLRNISVVGAGWAEYVREHPDYLARQWEKLQPLLASGAMQVPEPTVYAIDDAVEALASIEDRRATGKVALNLR
ncbi:NADPH:quinone oxidoreductase family protein [Rhodococcus sp. NPDC057014]|uniref:NADPH:quinone oxidoreductase family protein n=1 Tax=Rhodococcus sp. NPDC057014 TaxID=3346000 RepID=UPI00362C4803